MATDHDPGNRKAPAGAAGSGFGVLDECHRQTLAAIADLENVVRRLDAGSVDEQTRVLAAGVVRHFSSTARIHHEDEERHVFPKLMADTSMQETVQLLLQDHHWLEEDWRTLQPHLDAIACGQSWYDLDFLREGSDIFAALSRDHIALEESLLYPQALARLRPDELQSMEREMAARRRASRHGAGRGREATPS